MRIEKLGEYLELVLDNINKNYKRINADFLGLEIDNYSLDKIPTASIVEPYVTGGGKYKDVFSFRSRNAYSSDRLENLKNIGFFETFQSIIEKNNNEGKLPDIEGITNIKCLNQGTFGHTDKSGKTAMFEIQVQIEYEKEA